MLVGWISVSSTAVVIYCNNFSFFSFDVQRSKYKIQSDSSEVSINSGRQTKQILGDLINIKGGKIAHVSQLEQKLLSCLTRGAMVGEASIFVNS